MLEGVDESIGFKLKISWAWCHYQHLTYLFNAAKASNRTLAPFIQFGGRWFNNVSNIVGNVALLIRIRLARQPADRDHRFGHWKMRDWPSHRYIIMFTLALMFCVTPFKRYSAENKRSLTRGATLGVISAIIMFAVYLYNTHLSKQAKSRPSRLPLRQSVRPWHLELLLSWLVASTIQSWMDWSLLSLPSLFLKQLMIFSSSHPSAFLMVWWTTCSKIIKGYHGRRFLRLARSNHNAVVPGDNIYLDITRDEPRSSVFRKSEITDQVSLCYQNNLVSLIQTFISNQHQSLRMKFWIMSIKVLMREQLIDQGNQLEELLARRLRLYPPRTD